MVAQVEFAMLRLCHQVLALESHVLFHVGDKRLEFRPVAYRIVVWIGQIPLPLPAIAAVDGLLKNVNRTIILAGECQKVGFQRAENIAVDTFRLCLAVPLPRCVEQRLYLFFVAGLP